MSLTLITVASVVLAALCLLLVATFAVPLAVLAGQAGPVQARAGAWRWIAGILGAILVVINGNLWLPGTGLFTAVAVLALFAAIRIGVATRLGRPRVLCWSAPLLLVVVACALLTSWRLDAFDYWLLETSNHDSLFYFEGAEWAALHPVYADPGVVAQTLGLGTCRTGAVFLGNDCPVYRGGSYSLSAFAQHFGAGDRANDTLIGFSIAALLLALGLLPMIWAVAGGPPRDRGRTVMRAALLATLSFILFCSPGMLAAAVNSNVATTMGAAAVAMVLGLGVSRDEQWWLLRSVVLGLGAAIAAHCYGESALPAVMFAGAGVAADALCRRSIRVFVLGGLACAFTFLVAANVVVLELVQSANDINAIAKGGTWEGAYLHGNPLHWIAAPFAGLVVNGDPAVTRPMLIVGFLQASIVVLACILRRELRVALMGMLAFALLMIGYVEIREYSYGEHKIVQLMGPPATMLAAAALIGLLGTRRHVAMARVAAISIGLLLCASIVAQVMPTRRIVEFWKGAHGLSNDFASSLPPMQKGEHVVLDDAGVSGMERFQKSHYLVYMSHAAGARMLLPQLDADGMRGGYARSVSGNSLASAKNARWLLQLASYDGARSPFVYPQHAVRTSTEYDVVDLERAGPLLAVSGNHWKACDAKGCAVEPGFEVETLNWGVCHAPELVVHADGAVPAGWSSVDIATEGGGRQTKAFNGGTMSIRLESGWRRLVFAPVGEAGPELLRLAKVEVRCTGSGKGADAPSHGWTPIAAGNG